MSSAPGATTVAAKYAGDDWMAQMPEAMRKQMQLMVDMYLGAGIIMDREKFMELGAQGEGRACTYIFGETRGSAAARRKGSG